VIHNSDTHALRSTYRKLPPRSHSAPLKEGVQTGEEAPELLSTVGKGRRPYLRTHGPRYAWTVALSSVCSASVP
jgi:hypothetical protein